VPFTRVTKPLAQARVALITHGGAVPAERRGPGPGAKYNAAAKFYKVYSEPSDAIPDLRISHVGYDRKHTTAE
jgi:hypothetical protein